MKNLIRSSDRVNRRKEAINLCLYIAQTRQSREGYFEAEMSFIVRSNACCFAASSGKDTLGASLGPRISISIPSDVSAFSL